MPLFSLFALISLASLALYAGERGTVARRCVFRGYRGKCNPRYAVAILRSATDRAGGNFYPMIYGLLGWGRLSVGAPYLTARRYRLVC